jgi:hypothetical protein
MPVITSGGNLLLAPDGKLATSVECCCDETPCPDCCARITSGALMDGEIHFIEVGDPTSLEGEIVTASGTRVVCEDDEITITFRTDPGLGSVSPGAFANWDVVWEFVSLSPDVGTFGSSEERGFVDWTAVPEQEYTLTLRYNPCWNRETTGLGLIQIGFSELGLTHDITVETCPIQNCCDIDEDCEPCCYRILEGVFFDGSWWMYLPIDDEIYAIIKTTLRPDSRLICVGEGFDVEVFIGSRGPEPILVDVEIDTGAFAYSLATPAADETPDMGDPGIVKWFDRTERPYKVDVSVPCYPNEFEPGINVTVRNKNPGGGTNLEGPGFEYCAPATGCSCCCPRWCTCGCELPVSTDACDVNVDSAIAPGMGYRIDPDPQVFIENFKQERIGSGNWLNTGTFNVDPFGDCDRWTVEQIGESEHVIECYSACSNPPLLCAKSANNFLVPVQLYYCGVEYGPPTFVTVYRGVYPDVPEVPEGLRGECGWLVGDQQWDTVRVAFLGNSGNTNSYSMSNSCSGMREFYEFDSTQWDGVGGEDFPGYTWSTETEFSVSPAPQPCLGSGIIVEEEP